MPEHSRESAGRGGLFAAWVVSIKKPCMTASPQQVSGSGIAEVLKVLNGLVEKKLILAYAIGGGVAALYYLEPIWKRFNET